MLAVIGVNHLAWLFTYTFEWVMGNVSTSSISKANFNAGIKV